MSVEGWIGDVIDWTGTQPQVQSSRSKGGTTKFWGGAKIALIDPQPLLPLKSFGRCTERFSTSQSLVQRLKVLNVLSQHRQSTLLRSLRIFTVI